MKINRRLAAVDAKPLKYGKIFLTVFAVLLVPALIEIALFWSSKASALARGSIYASSPFLDWLQFTWGMSYELAQYYMVTYIVTLLMFAGGFLYYGIRFALKGLREN